MFRLTSVTINGMPLPSLDQQATVSIDAPTFDWLTLPPPKQDEFGITIVYPWVSPTLLKIAKPFTGSDFTVFHEQLCRALARDYGIPWEFLVNAARVS